jgi:hypothetical protein
LVFLLLLGLLLLVVFASLPGADWIERESRQAFAGLLLGTGQAGGFVSVRKADRARLVK